MTKLQDAWAEFEKAVRFEDKANDKTKAENVRRIALRAVDKALDRAVELEAEGLAAGERHIS